MGWKFKWFSSNGNDFNYDLNVSFTPEELENGKAIYNYAALDMDIDEREGVSAFYKDSKGDIFHTYSSYARGIDLLNTTYNFLDLTARGRDEDPEHSQDWVTYHDQYKALNMQTRVQQHLPLGFLFGCAVVFAIAVAGTGSGAFAIPCPAEGDGGRLDNVDDVGAHALFARGSWSAAMFLLAWFVMMVAMMLRLLRCRCC